MYKLGIIIFLLSTVLLIQGQENDTVAKSLFEMSIEELTQLDVKSTSLTDVKNKLAPLPIIRIDKEDIASSGARNLDELLEIFVPGMIMMSKGKTGNSIGVRGIISDRTNKILVAVNNRILNDRSLAGFTSERFISVLSDIDYIEVIQSPQSSLYGPGAISAVVNIYTKTAKSTGAKNTASITQGVNDYFTNVQLRHSDSLFKKLGYSLYYGGDYATGASQKQSPVKFSYNRKDGNGDTIIADQPISFPVKNLNSSPLNKPRHKAHVHIDYEDVSLWGRYTFEGQNFTPVQQDILKFSQEVSDSSYYINEHSTAKALYKKSISHFTVKASVSYDVLQTQIKHRSTDKTLKGGVPDFHGYREDELFSNVLISYDDDKMSAAIGAEISNETFGLTPFGLEEGHWWVEGKARGVFARQLENNPYGGEVWKTTMYTGVSEFQYLIRKNLNFLTGYRLDKHTYTDYLHSPRASIIWRPSPLNLVRFQYARSHRRADDGQLRNTILRHEKDTVGDYEKIDFYELSGEYRLNRILILQPSIYYSDYDIVAWHSKKWISENLGNIKYWGAEMSLLLKNRRQYGRISHSYVKLIDFTLALPVEQTPNNNVSAQPYGYGNDFHNFPNHLTKLVYQYSVSKKMAVNTSLQITWKLQGAEDAARHNADSLNNSLFSVISDGSTEAFKPSAYLHAGATYNINKNFNASIHGYNLLGLINENLNKRNEFQRNSQYRIQPVAMRLSLQYSL